MSYNWVTYWFSDIFFLKVSGYLERRTRSLALKPWCLAGKEISPRVFVYSKWLTKSSRGESLQRAHVCSLMHYWPLIVSEIHTSVPFPEAGKSFALSSLCSLLNIQFKGKIVPTWVPFWPFFAGLGGPQPHLYTAQQHHSLGTQTSSVSLLCQTNVWAPVDLNAACTCPKSAEGMSGGWSPVLIPYLHEGNIFFIFFL